MAKISQVDTLGAFKGKVTKKKKGVAKRAITGKISNHIAKNKKEKTENPSTTVNCEQIIQSDSVDVKNKSSKKSNNQGTHIKRKKSKKVTEVEEKQQNNDGDGEDAAESVDSGCIADSPSDIAGDGTDWPQVETVLLEENKFVSSLLKWLPIPKSTQLPEIELKGNISKKNTEADLEELRAKYKSNLEELAKHRKAKPADYLKHKHELKLSKQLKNLEKRKLKRLKRKTKGKGPTLVEPEAKTEKNMIKNTNQQKPIYNKNGGLVFSKFDFSNSMTAEDSSSKSKDLNQLLSQALKTKEKLKRLEQKGHSDVAASLAEQKAWSGALQKAEGLKVRDDMNLLKSSIKKKEGQKKMSQKKWTQRVDSVKKKKEDKNATRKKNIVARKETKLDKKMKKMKKKGHIVPGF